MSRAEVGECPGSSPKGGPSKVSPGNCFWRSDFFSPKLGPEGLEATEPNQDTLITQIANLLCSPHQAPAQLFLKSRTCTFEVKLCWTQRGRVFGKGQTSSRNSLAPSPLLPSIQIWEHVQSKASPQRLLRYLGGFLDGVHSVASKYALAASPGASCWVRRPSRGREASELGIIPAFSV